MTGEKPLRKQNQAVRKEIEDLRIEIAKITKDLKSSRTTQDGAGATEREMQPGRVRSVEFVSNQYDELFAFEESTMLRINQLTARVNEISIMCDSYQNNIKTVGMPALSENESSQQTALLCLKLFHTLGVKDVLLADVDTAHRVPSRTASAQPNAIVCKLERRRRAKFLIQGLGNAFSSIFCSDLIRRKMQ